MKKIAASPLKFGQALLKAAWRRSKPIITIPAITSLPIIGPGVLLLQQAMQELEAEEAAAQEVVEEETIQPSSVIVAPQKSDYLYKKYRCWCGDPLICDWPRQTVENEPKAKYCTECGFPANLAENAKILGSRGTYQVNSLVGCRGMGRFYLGTQSSNQQPVVIKEYLLPNRAFNQDEIRQRKAAFISLAGVNLADGRMQDFRLLSPWEAIADALEERCYLISKGTLYTSPTLRDYLAINGAMTEKQVRQVLNQVLQTLEFLHRQKYSLPSGQVQQGLPHGNLNLHSLLIDEQLFFIYLCDLALWERVFDPPDAEPTKPHPSDDLVALGYVGFYLLTGGEQKKAENSNPQSLNASQAGRNSRVLRTIPNSQVKDPRDERQWPTTTPEFKAFIFRLSGIDLPFESAQAARQALLNLPQEKQIGFDALATGLDEDQKIKTPKILFLLLASIGLLALAVLIWSLFFKPQDRLRPSPGNQLLACCIPDVPGIPPGNFNYSAEGDGIWSYALLQENLISKGKTLEQELLERQPKLHLSYDPEISGKAAIEKVQAGQADFAITSLVSELTSNLEYQEVAYDGLAVFVNFSYSNREKSLPNFLKGQITFEQLRQLYTGKITNWKELGGPDLEVKLYIPTDSEAVQIFEQRVLKNQESINAFRNLWDRQITPLPTFPTMRAVIRDFEEEEVGALAFGPLSQVFGQCSVYPLALVDGAKAPVQPLVQDNGEPVNPQTDLCNHKGSYHPDVEVFKSKLYPLGYPITVVYPRDNSRLPIGAKFADILRTREGQSLLSKTGLVPLQPLR